MSRVNKKRDYFLEKVLNHIFLRICLLVSLFGGLYLMKFW